MGATVSQITSLTIVYSIVYSGADQRKHHSSASLAFVRRIHRSPVNSPHKWPVTRIFFHLMTSPWGIVRLHFMGESLIAQYTETEQSSRWLLYCHWTPKAWQFSTLPQPIVQSTWWPLQRRSFPPYISSPDMMTSSNGNIFRVTGHLCGELTGDRWILHRKASDAELWCFLWSAPEQTIE